MLGMRGTHKSGRAGSSTLRTLSTAMGDSSDEYWLTTLLLSDLCQERNQQEPSVHRGDGLLLLALTSSETVTHAPYYHPS